MVKIPEVSSTLLSGVRIVLVEPQYGGNIGQCARALLNTGLHRLVLVNPRAHLTEEAFWMARDGRRLLEEAEVTGSLAEALRPVGMALATTRRIGRHRPADFTPRQAAAHVVPLLEAGNGVALVFGREDNGLKSEEIDLCQGVISIPASAEFPSLNLAQAVLVCAYELFLAALAHDKDGREEERNAGADGLLAGPERLERFYERLQAVLTDVGFLVGDQAPAVFRSLRRVFGRAGLDPRELKMLHGVLAQVEWFRNRAERERAKAQGEKTPAIRWARAADFDPVRRLLARCELPETGLRAPAVPPDDAHGAGLAQRVLVAEADGAIQGCVALEFEIPFAMLRSLAVEPTWRGRGLGARLVAEALDEARRLGVTEVALLTRDAADWFSRLGFERIARERFPEALKRSPQWVHGCCASAEALRLTL